MVLPVFLPPHFLLMWFHLGIGYCHVKIAKVVVSCRFFRIGTIILALHDTSDVFLETAKLCKYTEKELGASLFFGLFAISWLLLRLIYFPFWIIKTSSYHSITFLRKVDEFPTTLYYISNTMLLTLLVFHVYWGKLICLMIMRQLNNKGQVTDDVRSGK